MVHLPPAPDGQTLHALSAVTTHLTLLKVRVGEHLDVIDALLWTPIVTGAPHAQACRDVSRDRVWFELDYRATINAFAHALDRVHTTRTHTHKGKPQ